MNPPLHHQRKDEKESEKNKKPICEKTSKKEIEKNKKNSLNILIKLNVNEDDIYYYGKSNAFLQNISCYKEEVLIFPFTGFEVIDWETRNFQKEIKKNINHKN